MVAYGLPSLIIILVIVLAELGLRYRDYRRSQVWRAEGLGLRAETSNLCWEDVVDATRIVAFGDSIPYGWLLPYQQSYPTILEKRLRQTHPDWKIRVINAGVPGNTAVLGWMRLERDVLRYRPHLVLVGFGLNDANLARTSYDEQREEVMYARLTPFGRMKALLRKSALLGGLMDLCKQWGRHIPRPTPQKEPVRQSLPRTSARAFEIALTEIARKCQQCGAEVVFLTTTRVSKHMYPRASQRLRTLEAYNEIIRQVAARQRTHVIDLYRLLENRDDWEQMLANDGVHLTAAGQRMVADLVQCAIEPILTHLVTP